MTLFCSLLTWIKTFPLWIHLCLYPPFQWGDVVTWCWVNQGIEKIPTFRLCKKAAKTTKSYLTQNHHAKWKWKKNLVAWVKNKKIEPKMKPLKETLNVLKKWIFLSAKNSTIIKGDFPRVISARAFSEGK